MPATGNPRAALLACVSALAPLASTHDRAHAADMAQEALRGDPYPAASLETAACLWEAVLDMEREADDAEASEDAQRRGAMIRVARELHGTSALRLSVLSWVDAVDAAWRAVDTDNGKHPRGGQYGESFDWEFVPGWIIANVDWDGPNAPTVRRAPIALARDPWDGCDEATRNYLIAQAFEPEAEDAATFRAVCKVSNGAAIVATRNDGCGMPVAGSWAIGVYPPCSDDDTNEAVQMFYSDPVALTLPQAVAGALAMAHLFQPLPTPPAAPSLAFDVSFDLPVNAVVRGVASEREAITVARALAERIADTNECLSGSDYKVPAVTEFSICGLNRDEPVSVDALHE